MPRLQIPPIYLLELRFKAVAPINKLPHFHGAQWSALFRSLLKPWLRDRSLAEADVWVQSVETGVPGYLSGDPLHVGMAVPAGVSDAVLPALRDFNTMDGHGGHFFPGRTVILEQVACRVSGAVFAQGDETGENWTSFTPLEGSLLRSEADLLSDLDRFSILFHAPLRLKRPAGAKRYRHRYCDEGFFLNGEDNGPGAIAHLANSVRCTGDAVRFETPSKIAGGAMTWLDLTYGRAFRKTMGGVVGRVDVTGRPGPAAALRLVAGQYLGAGKNAVFGFGYYHIPELDPVRRIKPLARGRTLLDRAVTVDALRATRGRLPDSSPGPDGLTLTDITKAGDPLLESLSRSVGNGSYRQGDVKRYRQPKNSGGFREVAVLNTVDKLVQRAFADFLMPVTEKLLSDSAYAYRQGLNRQGAAAALKKSLGAGYTSGFKADISTYFDSVDTATLTAILEGIFPFEPLVAQIGRWLAHSEGFGIKGLPQGSPLSPALSNIYLDRFDRKMAGKGFRLVRYGDDFVVLVKPPKQVDEGLNAVEKTLGDMGLTLSPGKTVAVDAGTPFTFLGLLVGDDTVIEAPKTAPEPNNLWLPLFREQWPVGRPLYLSSICRGACSRGPCLVVNREGAADEKIPWNRISRIVVVGRSSFSGGVVYRAVRENIPVAFIDVMGRARGHLHPEAWDNPSMVRLQDALAKDEARSLEYAREVISAKIHNSHVLLLRNRKRAPELLTLAGQAKKAESLESLLGVEGTAARIYFARFAGLVDPFDFTGRHFRPPDGPVNAMLSFGYTLLYNRLASALGEKGFNPRMGFFHQGRGTHLALASDMMEPLRHIADRIVLALIHRKELGPEDFTISKSGRHEVWRLTGSGFRTFIRRFETTMASRFTTNDGEKMSTNSYLDEIADGFRRSLTLGISYRALRIV